MGAKGDPRPTWPRGQYWALKIELTGFWRRILGESLQADYQKKKAVNREMQHGDCQHCNFDQINQAGMSCDNRSD